MLPSVSHKARLLSKLALNPSIFFVCLSVFYDELHYLRSLEKNKWIQIFIRPTLFSPDINYKYTLEILLFKGLSFII